MCVIRKKANDLTSKKLQYELSHFKQFAELEAHILWCIFRNVFFWVIK